MGTSKNQITKTHISSEFGISWNINRDEAF